jgi:hypothetical protein
MDEAPAHVWQFANRVHALESHGSWLMFQNKKPGEQGTGLQALSG